MSFFFFPFFQYSPKFCVANKYLTLIFLCYFFHTSSAFVFTVGLNLLWSTLLFPSSLRNTTLVFFWDSPTDKTFYFKYKKVFLAITAAVIKCLFPPVFILWKESEWKRCDPRAWRRWLCLFFFSQWGLCSQQIKLHKYSQTTWNVNLKAVWKLNVCAFTSTCFLPVWFTPALPQQRLMTASPDHQQPITTQSGSSTLVSAGSSPRRRAASQCRLFVLPESRQSGPWLTSLKTPETQKQKAKKKKKFGHTFSCKMFFFHF